MNLEKYSRVFHSAYFIEPNTGCWLWERTCNKGGYGHIRTPYTSLAHRLSYILQNGEIPRGMMVLHKCDTRTCVNPVHLFLGTAQDNMDDMWRKGRGINGAKCKTSKITEQQAISIFQDPRLYSEVARDHNISRRQVCSIKQGLSWRHTMNGAKEPPRIVRPKRTKCSKGHLLTPENIYTAPGTGKRMCQTCRRVRIAANKERTSKSPPRFDNTKRLEEL